MNHSIDYLRRQAKQLKRGFAAGDPHAIQRARSVLPDAEALKHAQALHVIAHEQGYESWPRLKLASETAKMNREQKAERLKIALYYGQHWITKALLEAEPGLENANFGLQVALYDRTAVDAALKDDPEAAVRTVGIRSPILHLAFSRHIHAAPGRADDMIAIAEALLRNGADVNDSYPFEPGSEHRLSALYGALGHGDNMRLSRWLLENGADPNDNESLYHSTELGHHEGLKMLLEHGAVAEGTNALPRALDFNDIEAVKLLLEGGADPNEGIVPHPSGQPMMMVFALHQAARRMCSGDIAQLLIDHGADGTVPFNGHSAYAFACMFGNNEVADVLEHAGQGTALDAVEATIASAVNGPVCGRVDPGALTDETQRIMMRMIGFSGRLEHIKRLYAIGIDPEWTDEMGMTAIHVAGWEGQADAVAWLLTLNPDLNHKNDYGGDLLGTIIHGAEFCPKRAGRNHLECARLVLAKGAVLRQTEIDLCGVEDMTELLADWAEAHPRQVEDDRQTARKEE
ncbi:ankyrin repeat domain-containing protein [Hoeflea poritis]|uniref:Ankyrin repeat domain-containing protein n=1 Tax=Hoeflea poritis TaxID=2993659 RepID=A0ABT4VPX6_9HYPH|nr:ankyrin repeat domain-containing protein [Hoeflea poritis]MDA4846762.1 ankyrin repeat domain-containing protein [Hoeflea poritis]